MQKSNWSVPKLWQGREVWILGGGPSLSRQFGIPESLIQKVESGKLPVSAFSPYMKAIHDKPVIGVNMAFKLGDWIDMVFWGDTGFYRNKGIQQALDNFPGLKVAGHHYFCNPKFVKKGIYTLRWDEKKTGISDNPECICWNRNSGAAAISIAVNAGAKRIILVGFDMGVVPSHSHWHNEYGKPKRPPFKTHIRGFEQIAKDAKARGVEIINASPDSAITQFPKTTVKELIGNSKNIHYTYDSNIEASVGTLDKYKTLQHFQAAVKPNFYLEIGVLRGRSLKLSNAFITVGIDPAPKLKEKLKADVYKITSDAFFEENDINQTIDLAFIDGKHLIENVLQDFINVEKNCKKDSIILLDDVAPAHPVQANRVKQSIKWAGDVWKLLPILKQYRPDLDVKLLDVTPTGMVMITNLNPDSKVLETNKETIIKQWQPVVMPKEVISREGVYTNLDFLKKDFNRKYKIGVVTPTCSPERKPFLEFLEKRIVQQTMQPDVWIKKDYPNKTNTPDISKRFKEGIKEAFEQGCDFVLLMEDDDFYPKTYIEEMVNGWKQQGMPVLFGVKGTYYYHLKHKRFKYFPNNFHCSAFCTAVAPGIEFEHIPDNIRSFDIQLWKRNVNSQKLEIINKPIGIKHGIGMSGGNYHNGNAAKFPLNSRKLEEYVDKEALEFYEKIGQTL